MLSFLTKPNFPKAAVGIGQDRVTVIALQKQGRNGFDVRNAAAVDLPASLVQPQSLGTNISRQPGLRPILQEVAVLSRARGARDASGGRPSRAARPGNLALGVAG